MKEFVAAKGKLALRFNAENKEAAVKLLTDNDQEGFEIIWESNENTKHAEIVLNDDGNFEVKEKK